MVLSSPGYGAHGNALGSKWLLFISDMVGHAILLVGSTCHPAGGLGGGRRSGKMAGMFAVADGVVPQIGQATKKRGLVCLSVLTAGGEVHTRPLWVVSLFFKVTMVVREPYPDDLITL